MLNESKWSDNQLHIFGERKESVKLLKEFLGRYLCITLGHAYIAMSEHLTHCIYRYSLLKRDERGKGVSCCMCGKGKGYASSKAQCFKIRLIGGILHLWQQRFPFISSILLYHPNRFGQQLNTAKYTCLLPIELQPKTSLIITDNMLLAKLHQITIGCTCMTGKNKQIPYCFHFFLQLSEVGIH